MTSTRVPIIIHTCIQFSWFVLIAFIGFANLTFAQADDALEQGQPILPSAQLLMDDSKQFDAQAIIANPEAYSFTSVNPAVASLSLGYYRGAVWLRFNRHVVDVQKLWLVFEPAFLDDIRLYQLSSGGHLKEQRTGDHVPFSQRPVLTRKMVLPLNLSPGDNDFLLRVETRSAFTLSAQLWQAEPFLISQQVETLFYGVLFGLIVLAVLASILCAFWTRQAFFGWSPVICCVSACCKLR